jgi:hypothetical protein
MKVRVSVLVAAFTLTIAGCATQPAPPGWYAGDDAKYNKKDYLTGRGQAATLAEAQNRARADLAQIFQVAIKVVAEDVQKYKSNSATPGKGQFSVDTLQRITTYTDQVVKGIQIAETWRDPVSNNITALAILPRPQAEGSLRAQIRQLDEAVQTSIDQSKNNADVLARIFAANKAIAAHLEREGLQSALQVIDITGTGAVSPHSSARLKFDLEEMLKSVRISPKILNGSASGLEEVVTGALTHAGFSVDSAAPTFVVKASLKLSDIGIIDGWYWQRGSLEVSVSEAETGRVRGAQRWPIKGSGKERASAIRRSLDEASEVLKKELGTTITGMAGVR